MRRFLPKEKVGTIQTHSASKAGEAPQKCTKKEPQVNEVGAGTLDAPKSALFFPAFII